MSGCCDPSGYRKVFNSREARRAIKKFERNGLDATARPMVDVLAERDLKGATLLEVGAGSGTAQVELFRSGVERSVAYDISPSYEKLSGALLAKYGIVDRVEWHTGDFLAANPDPADVVFLNRVVCCYPDMERLVDAAAEHSERFVALSYPRDRWFLRVGRRVLNAFLRFRKVGFQVYLHAPDAIDDRLRSQGLDEVASGSTPWWHWKVWERAAA
jgi:hypothetical protein